MRNQKGITLIALVITIIVLLILAGVSIAMLTGENGILTNANEAQKQSTAKEAVEKINLALNSIKTEVLAQRIDNTSYAPVTEADELKAENITGLTYVTSGTGYTWSADTSSFTISYANDELGITGISGTITFSTDNPSGLITAAEYDAD